MLCFNLLISGKLYEHLAEIDTSVRDMAEYLIKEMARKQGVAEELKATLLVNPRPTTEEFTIYSFPSKNMEYMASGTPLLTTKLPGMPEEYHQYVLAILNII